MKNTNPLLWFQGIMSHRLLHFRYWHQALLWLELSFPFGRDCNPLISYNRSCFWTAWSTVPWCFSELGLLQCNNTWIIRFNSLFKEKGRTFLPSTLEQVLLAPLSSGPLLLLSVEIEHYSSRWFGEGLHCVNTLLGTFCPVTYIMRVEHFLFSCCDSVFLLTRGSTHADCVDSTL